MTQMKEQIKTPEKEKKQTKNKTPEKEPKKNGDKKFIRARVQSTVYKGPQGIY